MSGVRFLALAGAAASLSAAALAADLPATLPLVVEPALADESGWYLRGDVGIGVQRFRAFDHFQTNPAFVWPASWQILQMESDDATLFDFGVGYAVNNWLRFDVIGEHRGMAKLKVLGSYLEFCAGRAICFDQYDASHSAEVFLANAYLDLGTWWYVTPFVGVGVGAAYNSVLSLTDTGLNADGTTGYGYASVNSSSFNFAWAAHAGLAYNVSRHLKLEFAYRYLSLGSVRTPIIDCSSTGCVITPNSGPSAFYTLTNFNSQDFKLGLRWMLEPEPPAYPPPLIRKG
jgi:opacity protein-like surface antigen